MIRIALGVEYDGSRFYGFQRQKSTKETIQGHLERAISKVADHSIKSYCSGRTDAGVHAFMQVIHFDSNATRTQQEWIRGVNSYLPNDIRIVWSRDVDESFHARFSANNRSYLYNILNDKTPSALWSQRSLFIPQKLDVRLMKAASRYLIGEKDFSSFRGAGCQSKSPIRNIESLEIERKGSFLTLEIKANAFLLHMVRIVTGTLLLVGKKEIKPKEIEVILKAKDRRYAGKTVSSEGLYFMGPQYPKKYKIPTYKNNLM